MNRNTTKNHEKKEIKLDFNMSRVEKIIHTTAKCIKSINLHGDTFDGDKIYDVLIEIKGNILENCYSEYVYVDGIRLITEEFFQHFDLI